MHKRHTGAQKLLCGIIAQKDVSRIAAVEKIYRTDQIPMSAFEMSAFLYRKYGEGPHAALPVFVCGTEIAQAWRMCITRVDIIWSAGMPGMVEDIAHLLSQVFAAIRLAQKLDIGIQPSAMDGRIVRVARAD
ncbi:MAG: hypothetical protein R6V30_06975 [Paracoccaceae bacterium]